MKHKMKIWAKCKYCGAKIGLIRSNSTGSYQWNPKSDTYVCSECM